jgi:putative transposase
MLQVYEPSHLAYSCLGQASWLNQVERWFGIITQRAIRSGSFSSVKELIAKIELLVAAYNKTKAPFNSAAAAASILEKLQRLCLQISGSAH